MKLQGVGAASRCRLAVVGLCHLGTSMMESCTELDVAGKLKYMVAIVVWQGRDITSQEMQLAARTCTKI